jgi:hypothetical protein
MALITKPIRKCVNCGNEFYRENGVDEAETLCSVSCYNEFYEFDYLADGFDWRDAAWD